MSVPVVALRPWEQAAVGAGAWVVLSVAVGYAAHRVPVRWLTRERWLTRPRSWELDGRWFERRLRITRWKHRLPEAGAFFRGGVTKSHLGGRDPATLSRFVVETRRAELVHWALLGSWPVFALWSEGPVLAAMAVYALVANVPCIVVQRYNRVRLLRLLARPGRRRREA